jgi:peptide-methionine (S)-S-oxide reductase
MLVRTCSVLALASFLLAGCAAEPDGAPRAATKPTQENPTVTSPRPAAPPPETATFGAGCFWCVEAVFQQIPGVLRVQSGYMGGTVADPSYQQVCTGETGHAEVVQLTFDPARVSFGALADWFFKLHDPTTLNRQGPDEGTQYRSAVFFHSEAQRREAEAAKQRAQPSFRQPIVTEITAAGPFYAAEDYHQDYYRQNRQAPYCRVMIAPKLDKLGLEK